MFSKIKDHAFQFITLRNVKNGKLIAGSAGLICAGVGIYKLYRARRAEGYIYGGTGLAIGGSLIYQHLMPECFSKDALNVVCNACKRNKRILVQLALIGAGLAMYPVACFFTKENDIKNASFRSGYTLSAVNCYFALSNAWSLLSSNKYVKEVLKTQTAIVLVHSNTTLVANNPRNVSIWNWTFLLLVLLSIGYVINHRSPIQNNNQQQNQNNDEN